MSDEFEDSDNSGFSFGEGPTDDDSPAPRGYTNSGRPKKRGSGSAPDDYWNSDEALENLKLEKEVNPHESNEQLTKRIFDEAAPAAAMGLVHLALHGTNENTRLNAQKYVTERVLGRVGDDAGSNTSPLEELLSEFHSKLEDHANQ